ncbi:ABC transporter ATP-binding protein [Actinomadura livida]|uniref:ABC transporter ATP-binding protein n=1 Tax=Actinomadura livida TaxID=79909 RepID=A0A7W7MZV1_9ACTN|nr:MULTISPECIES: ABC transporter ATP-binding protein [Actinomadura]MBB4777321.1 branched-chain amino acid transport system ATP-binding protein [Actinomadura catellatispora]GGU20073.1 ABC transporter ATP-binding protein [Actinomadura livida]
MTETTDALEIRGLSAGYRGVPAIRDIDLRVAAGSILALLGPNGAGKSTTLRAAAGLLPALGGTVTAAGSPVTGSVERATRAGLCLIPDNRGVFHRLTVAENLRLAKARGGSGPALDRFPQLRPLLNRRCGLLSGGEQQLLAIAKTLLLRPRVLLIDEMSMGLSPVAIRQILPELRRLADEDGTAIVLVEQHIDQALSVADEAVVLHHGRVVLTGPAAELREDRDQVQRAYFGDKEH